MTYIPNLPLTRSQPTTLQIALLGPPTLIWAGRPFPIARRQARALHYRIAAALQPVPREQPSFLFWPENAEPAARRNLTVLLTQIRRALPRPDLLVTQDGAIGLDHAAMETDTATLATQIAQASSAGQIDLLADALRQYRGPFLDGFTLPDSAELDTWASQERRYLDALAMLAEGYAADGAYPAAIEAAQPALALAQKQIEHARAQSTSAAFERALQHCRSLALDQAVALALSLLEATNPESDQSATGGLAITA